MARYTVSPKAKRELVEIWAYIARDGVNHADRWLARVYELFAILGTAPALGPTADEIHPGVRRFPLGQYIIYYRITMRGVQIVHVFHGKRDQRAAFKKDRGTQ